MRRKRRLANRAQRPVVSDTLPFEVPITFSNRHFADLLVKYDVRMLSGVIQWEADDDRLDVFMRILTGVAQTIAVVTSSDRLYGKTRHLRQIEIAEHNLITMPFQFDICHRSSDARRLTIPHPLNQMAVAEFYNEHSSTIIYHSNRSPFSLRRPVSVARYSNFRDRTHLTLLERERGGVEEHGKEYDQLGSYFVYEAHNNVFKFFESYRYHRSEKRFNAMAKVDISKCFDSIYTHSLPWAIHGKRSIKDNLVSSKSTFAGAFDKVMQNLNQNETNGIVIGPEFSRIFAELILQSADTSVERRLRQKHLLFHKKDYEIFRYVDDYYIFYNQQTHFDIIFQVLCNFLLELKLSINPSKTVIYEKPVITEITIAKNAVRALLNDLIKVEVVEEVTNLEQDQIDEIPKGPLKKFKFRVSSRDLIIGYKSALKVAQVSYLDVGNYTFSLIESKIDDVLTAYTRCEQKSERELVHGVTSIMEFCFFIYASAPRVNSSIRITRLITTLVRAFQKLRIDVELKHHLYKYVHDNAVHQLRKNNSLEFKEIETLYLLIALSELGKEYWIDELILSEHLKISKDSDGTFFKEDYLNHFSITVCLMYMKTKKKYDALRKFIEAHIVDKISAKRHYRHKDAETLMLFLDILACPFVSDATKVKLGTVYDLAPADLQKLMSLSENWFTTWVHFNAPDELDAKRLREVY